VVGALVDAPARIARETDVGEQTLVALL